MADDDGLSHETCAACGTVTIRPHRHGGACLAALRARAEKAERELAIFRDPHRLDLCKHDVLQRDCRTCSPAGVSAARFREAVYTISALRVVATRYMDALERYGEHDGDCAASVVGAPGDAPCTCGYEAALAATGDEEGKGGDRA